MAEKCIVIKKEEIDIDTDTDLTLDAEEKVGSEDTTNVADMWMAEEEDVGEDIIYLLKKKWAWNIIGDAENPEDTENVVNIVGAEESTV